MVVIGNMIFFAQNALVFSNDKTLENEVTIVTFGDSTTAPRGKLKVYTDCLRRELPGKGIKANVINAGVPGNTTANAKARFKKDVLDQHPDIVIIQFGINDSAVDVWKKPPATRNRVVKKLYIKNLEYFIDALQKKKCKIILMTPNSLRWTSALKFMYGKPPYRPDDPDGFSVTLSPYADSVREIARKKKIPIIDVYAAYQDYGKIKGQSIDDLLLDGMHPNDKGHRIVTDLLLKEILKLDFSDQKKVLWKK